MDNYVHKGELHEIRRTNRHWQRDREVTAHIILQFQVRSLLDMSKLTI